MVYTITHSFVIQSGVPSLILAIYTCLFGGLWMWLVRIQGSAVLRSCYS